MSVKCPKCQADNPDTATFCADCGTRIISPENISVTKTLETPAEEYPRGSTFADRYKIIEKLGKGGMGAVYRVEDTNINQDIALKLVKSDISSDEKTIERFRNELKTTRMISHRNVCRMFDLSETEGTYYITMEYVSGEDLKSFIKRSKRLSIPSAISIAQQVCEGLEEAHKLGVVHRDLKPSNIMIDREGNARIMDFGIARSLEAKGITGPGVMIGTPEYMSPEQAEAKEVDHRSDIYSLGLILYEMVTGRVPFEGNTALSIAMKHKSETPRDPKEYNAQIPDDLSTLILKCLEKDKDNRFQSAGELQVDLENIEKGIPTTDSAIPRRKPLTSKEITVTFGLKKFIVPALAVAAVIIIAIFIWKPWAKQVPNPVPTDKPSLAVMYFKNNTGEDNLDHWRTMLSNLLITDLAQSKHLRILSEEKLFNILNRLGKLEARTYSSEVLKQVAVQGRINHILQGAYAKAGDEFRINVTLQEASTGEIIGSESVAGEGEENIFSMVDELTRLIKANFKLTQETIANDIDIDIGIITTSSPEAYRLYSEGFKYINRQESSKGRDFLEKAIAIDPGFAMAYRKLAMSHPRNSPQRNDYLQKALELSNRASKAEQYLIQGDYYRGSEKTYEKAISAYKNLLELYPDHSIANTNLGLLYFELEEWDKAIERFELNVKNRDHSGMPYVYQARSYMAKGMYDKAKEVCEFKIKEVSDISTGPHSRLAYCYICQNNYDLALMEIDKIYSFSPSIYTNMKGIYYLFNEDFDKAETELKDRGQRLAALYLLQGKFYKLKEAMQEIESGNSHRFRSYLNSQSEDLEQALTNSENAIRIAAEAGNMAEKRLALHQKGLVLIGMKSLDEAQRTADELKEIIENGMHRKSIRYYYHLIGMIALENKNYLEAIDYFRQTISFLPHQWNITNSHALFINSLAFAYFSSENYASAEDEYKKLIDLTLGRFYYGDIYAKSFYMLGKIYEQQGDTAKAIEHYQKFLTLWKDADPGIAEVEDAKKRLAGLRD